MTQHIDTVTRELIWNSFTAIAEEMAIVEYRSSFSPVIREMLDFACSLLDPQGRLLADSGHTPAQVGTLELALQGILKKFGALQPGDMVITNDPYNGTTHLPDVEIFTPVYYQDTLLGYTASVAHHTDIGGISPGNRGIHPGQKQLTRDIYEEGLQLPAVKLYSGGVRNDAVWEIMMGNVRDPDSSTGDFGAQVSSCARGALRLQELAEKFGADTVISAMDALLEDTRSRATQELSTWPSKKVTIDSYLDGDGLNFDKPIHLRVSLQVLNGEVHVDFEGTDAQVPGIINVPLASTHAAVYYGIRCFLGEHIRQNNGYMSLIRLNAPLGSLVNPRKPAAVVARHMVVQLIADTIFRLVGQLIPEKAVASSHVSFPVFHVTAFDERKGVTRSMMDMIGGGGGARQGCSGDSGIDSYTSNSAILPAEVIEIDYPWRVVQTSLAEDSAGEGQWPGGMGIHRIYELLSDSARGRVTAEQQQEDHAPKGVLGGKNGSPARLFLKKNGEEWKQLSSTSSALVLSRGDQVAVIAAGGGGYGSQDS